MKEKKEIIKSDENKTLESFILNALDYSSESINKKASSRNIKILGGICVKNFNDFLDEQQKKEFTKVPKEFEGIQFLKNTLGLTLYLKILKTITKKEILNKLNTSLIKNKEKLKLHEIKYFLKPFLFV